MGTITPSPVSSEPCSIADRLFFSVIKAVAVSAAYFRQYCPQYTHKPYPCEYSGDLYQNGLVVTEQKEQIILGGILDSGKLSNESTDNAGDDSRFVSAVCDWGAR